jgi:type II secretory pathway component PulF
LGKVLANSSFSAFFRNLGIMLGSGLSLEYALRTESEIAENLVVRQAADDMKKAVSQGRRVGEEMGNIKNLNFPRSSVQMISIGEASGKLEESCMYLADFFEDEAENQAKNAASFLEPMLLIIIAIVVAFVALAVVLPIYSLTGSIG